MGKDRELCSLLCCVYEATCGSAKEMQSLFQSNEKDWSCMLWRNHQKLGSFDWPWSPGFLGCNHCRYTMRIVMWTNMGGYTILWYFDQILTRAWSSQSSVLYTIVSSKSNVTAVCVYSDAPFHSAGPFSLSSSSSGLCRISGLSCWSETLIKFDLLWSIVFSYREFSSRYGLYGSLWWRVRYVWENKIFQSSILCTKHNKAYCKSLSCSGVEHTNSKCHEK